MKFKVFSIGEIIGKAFSYITVLVVSIGAIAYYFIVEDKSDTYIVATLYAAFLFLAGIYLSNRDKKIDSLIYQREDYYVMFGKLRALFETRGNLESDDDMKSFIISFWVFSGRGDNSEMKNPRIRECGFRFTNKLNQLEQNYFTKLGNMERWFQKEINNFLHDSIKVERIFFSEMSFLQTNYEEWCNKNISDKESRDAAKNYIYSLVESKRSDIDDLELKRKSLKKYYEKCYKKLLWNINRIEVVYGDALQNLIYQDEQVLQEMDDVKIKLDELRGMTEELASCVEQDLRDDYFQKIDEVYELIKNAHIDIINVLEEKIEEVGYMCK